MRPSRLLSAALFATSMLASGFAFAQTATSPSALVGFGVEDSARERALETRFDSYLNGAEQREWLRLMSSKPNNVGSPHDKANADWMLDKLKSWGWDAHIETFYVLYPTPRTVAVELLGPHPFKLHLIEPPIPGDASSAQTQDVLPPYLAYQGDGDVTAEIVYANYGMPDDYKALARMGIDVRGKIVITRYGGGWRGLKPKLAQEHGAVGCLIYSDPMDDGYGSSDVYPKGGARPPYGVQRGSVQDMMLYSSDPLTPGIGATKDAKRLTREEAKTILKIPALPISYAEAQPLLEALGGQVAPRNFRGALPITYHVGPSTDGAKVHLVVKSDWGQKPIYDVVAVMKGSVSPDQWVLRGNHHDGWVFGAHDPLSGNVAMMQEAKALSELAKTGWKPKRTIVYASWDAEEPGLIGSTEFAEEHAAELQKKAVVYINTDDSARGFLSVEGSHDLEHMVNQTAADVRDPEQSVSLLQRQRAVAGVRGYDGSGRDPRATKRAAGTGDLPIGPLGSGSDYSSFVQHLGIPSVNLAFGGEADQAGVYHSAYDTFEHFSRFGDPKFEYGVALSETAGRMVLRTADADVLPFTFEPFADTVAVYVDELKKLVTDTRDKTATTNRLVRSGAFEAAAHPTKTMLPPATEDAVPTIDFALLDQATTRLKASAKAYDAALAAGVASPTRRAAANAVLQTVDQALLDPEGLPGRPWFKNLAYAPGMLTGYGAKTLPGVREALESRRWTEAQTYVGRTAKVLNAYAERIDRAAAALKGA